MINPWLSVGLVLAVLGGSMACLNRMGDSHDPELVRKTLHVSMGLFTLSFPWLFVKVWPVAVLAAVAVLTFLVVRAHGPLQRSFGRVLNGVSRTSLGEIYFVFGTGLVFVVSSGDKLMFCIPVLVLTLADATAALVGTRFGCHRYSIGDAQKSIEGSAAFFVVALLCTYVSLSLFTSLPRPECATVSVLVASAATVLEAIAGHGLDNLVVPVGVFAVLNVSGAIGSLQR